jgi:hypothetical protein
MPVNTGLVKPYAVLLPPIQPVLIIDHALVATWKMQ